MFAAGAVSVLVAAGGVVAAGASVLVAAVELPEKRLLRDCDRRTVSEREVTKKMAAKTEVTRVKRFAPPELPKMVWLDPPSDALISAPFPD